MPFPDDSVSVVSDLSEKLHYFDLRISLVSPKLSVFSYIPIVIVYISMGAQEPRLSS